MITIFNFLDKERNNYTRQLLLETIERLATSDIEREELMSNVYSITICPKQNEVLVSDDICPDENPPISFPLDEFYQEIENFEAKEYY